MRIVVLVPCFNEEAAVEAVVRNFSTVLPEATVYVYDNNSTDRTREVAAAAGAVVRRETRQGKGFVIQRMFADVDADVYVLVDGDNTYDAASAPGMIERLRAEQLDLVTGARVAANQSAYRPGHRFGNAMLSGLVALLFENRFADMLTGYRVFSRRFVKTFTGSASGFEIETELTVHALALRMPGAEMEIPYRERPEGSSSKLRTFRDGFRILWMILRLVVGERPLFFFGTLAIVFAAASLVLIFPVILTYLETGLVPRLPTAVLCTSLMVLSFLSLSCGLILNIVTRARREAKRLRYLELPAPPPLETKPSR